MKREVGLSGKTRKTLGKDKDGDWVLITGRRISQGHSLATVGPEKMRSSKKWQKVWVWETHSLAAAR